MIKTFSGLMADDSILRIRLGTNDGLIGYKIKKFQLMPETQNVNQASLFVISTVEPDAVFTTVDFNSPIIIGAGSYRSKESTFTQDNIVVFENVKFNQDIFITHNESSGTRGCNFYLELEQIRLDLNEATVATLKDMRGRA